MRWNEELIRAVLEECYSKFSTRSMGLFVQMSYNLAAKPEELFNLTWDDLDLGNGTVTFPNRTVQLDNALWKMLKVQQKELGFQPYVICRQNNDHQWVAFNDSYVFPIFKRISKRVDTPEGLTYRKIRYAAIQEMIESGESMQLVIDLTGLTEKEIQEIVK